MDTPKKPTIPTWVWAIPVLFGLPGGIVSWAILRKRESAGGLIVVGLIISFATNVLVQVIL